MTRIGDIGTPAIVANDEPYAYYVSLALLKCKKELIDANFLKQRILSEQFQKELWSKTLHVAFPKKINKNEIGECNLYICHLSEQMKIAEFLSLVDKRIEKQRRLVENLKKYKRGLLNLIFDTKIGDRYKLEDILIEVNEKSKINNEYPILSSTKNGLYLQEEYFNKQAASENTIGYKILRKNEIVFSPQNLWMGNINYNSNFEVGIVSPSYKIYKVNSYFSGIYIGELLKTPKALKEYNIASEQGASIVRRNLNMEMFNEIQFLIPSKELQEKYLKYLSLYKLTLGKQEMILSKLNKIKIGLLQQMFI